MNYVCGINTLESPQEFLPLYACTCCSSASRFQRIDLWESWDQPPVMNALTRYHSIIKLFFVQFEIHIVQFGKFCWHFRLLWVCSSWRQSSLLLRNLKRFIVFRVSTSVKRFGQTGYKKEKRKTDSHTSIENVWIWTRPMLGELLFFINWSFTSLMPREM